MFSLVKTSLSLAVLCVASFAAAQDNPDVPPAAPVIEPTPVVPGQEPSGPATKTTTTNTIESDAQRVSIPQVLGIDIRLGGYFWADIGYLDRTNAQPGQYDQGASYLQGRFVLGANFSRSFGAYYATAQVQFLGLVNEFAHSQYEPHTLDAYLRVGHQKWWDLQVGRFLAWEIYHRGQGIELFTAEEAGALGGPPLYWLELSRGYINEAGQAAAHFYPTDFLKFELSSVYGQQNNQNLLGVRPAAHLTLNDFQLLAGYEYLSASPQTSADKTSNASQGYAARAQYTFFKTVTAGAEFAQAFVDAIDINGDVDTLKSLTKYTFGGYVDIDFWHNSIGLGYHRTNQLDKRGEFNNHDQAFITYQYRFPIQGLSAKLVYGFARAHVQDADTKTSWDNYMQSVRLRISYEFN